MLARTLVPLVLICLSLPSLASTTLTLDQALKDFDKSPQVAKAASVAQEASWRRVEAFGGFLPTINASAVHLLDKKYALLDVPGFAFSIPQIVPTTTYTVTATWTLFDGLANWNHFQSARDKERASVHESEWTKFTGRRDVILSFYRALATHTLNEVAQQNLKVLEDHLQNSRLFRKAGLNTKFDVLQVEVQTSKARSDARSAADAEVVSQLRLGELLGTEIRDRTIEGKLPELDEAQIANLDTRVDSRADLKALHERLEGMDQQATADGKHWFPKIGLMGQYQNYNNRGDDLTGDQFRDAYMVGVQLSWNYDGLVGPSARAGAANEERYQAERSLEIANRRAVDDVEVWKRRYLYSVANYKNFKDDVTKAEESVRLAREGRKAGTRTNTELLDAESELFRTRAQVIESQIGAVEALVNLEMATGHELYRFQ